MTIKYRSRRNAIAYMMLFVPLLAACVTKTIAPNASSSTSAAEGNTLGPSLVIEQFLRAANANDLDTMAQLFGTKEGPFNRNGSQKDIDDRMFVIATVLRHTDFTVKGEGNPVPGRRNEAKNMMVELTRKEGKITVPFRLVQYKKGWLVEDVCMATLTNPTTSCGAG